jgi:hypothetical protein
MPKKKAPSTLPRITIEPSIRNKRLRSVKVSGKKFPVNTIINIDILLVDKLNNTKFPFFTFPIGNMNFHTDGTGAFSARYTLLYDQVYESNEYSSLVLEEYLLVVVTAGRRKVMGILKDIWKYNPYNVNNG